jgi:hypothetical protein
VSSGTTFCSWQTVPGLPTKKDHGSSAGTTSGDVLDTAMPRWPLFGRPRTLNAAAYCAPMNTISAGQQRNGQVAGVCDTVYGSDVRATKPPKHARRPVHTLRVASGQLTEPSRSLDGGVTAGSAGAHKVNVIDEERYATRAGARHTRRRSRRSCHGGGGAGVGAP